MLKHFGPNSIKRKEKYRFNEIIDWGLNYIDCEGHPQIGPRRKEIRIMALIISLSINNKQN